MRRWNLQKVMGVIWGGIGLLTMGMAATIYVAPNGDDSRTGSDWANALLTISNGVAKANIGDVVLVSNGVYNIATNLIINKGIILRGLNRTNTIIMGDSPNTTHRGINLTISNAVVEEFTITKCGGFNVHGGGVLITNGILRNCIIVSNFGATGGGIRLERSGFVEGCQILDNVSSNDGGGIYVMYHNSRAISNCLVSRNMIVPQAPRYGAGVAVNNCGGGTPITITDCVISNNFLPGSSTVGGGMSFYNATCVLDRCSIVHNTTVTSTVGVGIAMLQNVSLLMRWCVVSNNVGRHPTGGAVSGGGVSAAVYPGTSLTMQWCHVVDNFTPRGSGCGVFMSDGLIENSVIARNVAYSNMGTLGVGICVASNKTAVIRNCLIADNMGTNMGTAEKTGGGLFIDQNATVTVANCTIVRNFAKTRGGGIAFHSTSTTPDDFIINSIIVSNANAAEDAHKDLCLPNDVCSNAFYYCCSEVLSSAVQMAQGNITNAPVFITPINGDYRLAWNSPGVDAGTNQPWMLDAVDLDGRPRIDRMMRRVDMGCYERLPHGGLVLIK